MPTNVVLKHALNAGRYIDQCSGLEEHPNKREVSANCEAAMAGLDELDIDVACLVS